MTTKGAFKLGKHVVRLKTGCSSRGELESTRVVATTVETANTKVKFPSPAFCHTMNYVINPSKVLCNQPDIRQVGSFIPNYLLRF